MAQPFNAVESEMGITSYMSPSTKGFAAVVKARYSDFIVHEVSREGKVARLESLQPPPDDAAESSCRKRKHGQEEAETSKLSSLEEQWKIAELKLTECVGSDAAKETIALLQHWQDDDASDCQKFVTLPPLKDKDARGALHNVIREYLSFCARGDTQDGRVRIWHKRFEKEMPNYGKFDARRKAWPSDRPDYLQFCMYKENMDTSFCIKEIERRLSGKKKKGRIGYAGMKDKRGVTTQFCTIYRQEPETLVKAINKGGHGGGHSTKGGVGIIRVGNFEYVPNDLSLGMLGGNRFDVVLRNVNVDCSGDDDGLSIARTKQCLEAAAVGLREEGFINYFGMQRFGKYYDTHKVGVCVIKGDFKGAVDIIMKPKSDEHPRVEKARQLWAKRFERLDNNGETSNNARKKAESDCAKQILRDMGRYMTCEVSILNSLLRKPLDYQRAFGCIPRNMRLMFLHALQSFVWNHVASFRIDTLGRKLVVGDVVLVNNKAEDEGGSGTSGLVGKDVKVVDETDVASGTFHITDVVLPLIGTKVQLPTNDSGALFDSLLADHGVTIADFGKVQDRALTLGGDYRKLVCKPTDVDCEIVEYKNPLVPLLKTDLMELEQTNINESPTPTGEDKEKKNGDILLGMVVGFTLPPSSYATITLREIMKRPTSSDYQKQLKLEGKCEEEPTSAQHVEVS